MKTLKFYFNPLLLAFGIIGILTIWGGSKELRNIEYIAEPSLKICQELSLKESSIIVTQNKFPEMKAECWIKYYSRKYNIGWQLPYQIAKCENGFKNIKHYNGSGIFAFIQKTWKQECHGDVLNIRQNVQCGVRLISEDKLHHWGYPGSSFGSYACWKTAK